MNSKEGKEIVREYLEVLNEFKITGQDKQLFIFGTKEREREKSQVLGLKGVQQEMTEGIQTSRKVLCLLHTATRQLLLAAGHR